MKEIEVKAKIENIENIKDKLLNLGCTFNDVLFQKDIIFLQNGIEFGDIKKGMPVLRIRNSNGVVLLTLKKTIIDENELIKLEKEVVVSDENEMISMLESMEYHEVLVVNKKRIECKYNEISICIDEVDGLGSFIEVEILSDDDREKELQDYLFTFLKSLDVYEKDRVFKGYDTLIYDKSSKK